MYYFKIIKHFVNKNRYFVYRIYFIFIFFVNKIDILYTEYAAFLYYVYKIDILFTEYAAFLYSVYKILYIFILFF